MIFADKLIQLRKKAGWSQEELAEQMNVTRQSVSKWEGAQSVPDLEKIIHLSNLFGVSTDYLLKDEIENAGCHTIPSDDVSTARRVSMEEANAFLSVKAITSKSIALATFLCIISPICLLILGAISEVPEYGLADNVAGGIGMIILLILVTLAVAIFISSGRKTAAYDYLEKEELERVEDILLEAKFVARRIKELIDNGYMVSNKDKTLRRVKYKDIAILLRSTQSLAPIYEQEISKLNIPVFCDTNVRIFRNS